MTIKGGISIDRNDIEISFTIGGGRQYKRIYNDAVELAINNFAMISESLTELKRSNIEIYMRQINILFQYAHVETLNGNNIFQINYNLWLINGYIKMLLQSKDMKLIAQLLNLDNILYSVEEAAAIDDQDVDIDYKLPSNIKLDTKKIKISTPKNESIDELFKSLNENIKALTKFITLNKPAIKKIYKTIVKTASKNLDAST